MLYSVAGQFYDTLHEACAHSTRVSGKQTPLCTARDIYSTRSRESKIVIYYGNKFGSVHVCARVSINASGQAADPQRSSWLDRWQACQVPRWHVNVSGSPPRPEEQNFRNSVSDFFFYNNSYIPDEVSQRRFSFGFNYFYRLVGLTVLWQVHKRMLVVKR